MSKKILFIHHGGIAGGAPLSMLYTMRGMRSAGYKPLAGLVKPLPELRELYGREGFETLDMAWVPTFITWSGSEGKRWNPYTWQGIYRAWSRWGSAKKRLLGFLDDHTIDIVHLNSVSLSNPATALMEVGRPFIWHVREHGPHHQGRRFRFISDKLRKASQVIFLSAAEQHSWLGNTNHGTVVHNFVDFTQFDNTLSTGKARESLGVSEGEKVILYVGGSKKHKGVIELLKALGTIKQQGHHDFTCLMPDSEINPENPTRTEREMEALIREYNLEPNCRLLPFDPDIVKMFSACDLLVFPATQPHFARPVVEASAMRKPVIASALPPMDELVLDGETGLLTPAKDWKALAAALYELLSNEDLANRMGEKGSIFARDNFGADNQMKKIISVYDQLDN